MDVSNPVQTTPSLPLARYLTCKVVLQPPPVKRRVWDFSTRFVDQPLNTVVRRRYTSTQTNPDPSGLVTRTHRGLPMPTHSIRRARGPPSLSPSPPIPASLSLTPRLFEKFLVLEWPFRVGGASRSPSQLDQSRLPLAPLAL